jgi:hypothetical protein
MVSRERPLEDGMTLKLSQSERGVLISVIDKDRFDICAIRALSTRFAEPSEPLGIKNLKSLKAFIAH